MFRAVANIVAVCFGVLLSANLSGECVAQTANKPNGVTVLYFHSQDCQPCRQLEPILVQLHQQGWDVRAIDAPKQLEMARHFRIENLPTLILLRENKEADRIVGLVSGQQLGERLGRLSAFTQPIASDRNTMVVRGQSPSMAQAGFPMLNEGSHCETQGQDCPTALQPTQYPTVLASSTSSGRQLTSEQAVARATDATVRIKVEESNTTAHGTGTIVAVHGQEALVLTCGHLFRDMLPGSHLKVDLFAGTPRQTTILAQLIDFKADKEDIALLSIRLPVPIEPVTILPKSEQVQIGQPVFSIGCDHGNNPSRRDTRITHVNRYLGPKNIEIEGAPAVGRSGGGLFDTQGRLLGVCNAACNQENEGIYAASDVIYQQLARVDHAHLYELASDASRVPAVPAVARVPSEQEPNSSTPMLSDSGKSVSGHFELGQAGWGQAEPEKSNTGETQLICIVRTPGAVDRVVTIDQAPMTLLGAIEKYSANVK